VAPKVTTTTADFLSVILALTPDSTKYSTYNSAPVDGKYRIPILESFRKFLKEDKTDLFRYIPEEFDCDDFSFRLMGQVSYPGWSDIAFGIATSQTHAYNCIVAEDGEGQNRVYLVEPQTDK
ncbi:unnamed protein product, partial [marine sediment metagenome]